MSPVVLQQIWTSLWCIMGDEAGTEGEERLQRLAFNSRYLRLGLKRLGFIVCGHDDSPIIPLLLYNPAKCLLLTRDVETQDRSCYSGLSRHASRSVKVLLSSLEFSINGRVRFCVSAAHTKDDLDRLLRACDEVGDILQLKF